MNSKEYQAFAKNLPLLKIKTETPIEELRENFEKMMAEIPVPEGIRKEPLMIDQIPACWFLAEGATKKKMILLFHGGGYCAGSIASHQALAAALSETSGAAVLCISYRLAPEHPYPAALEDALKAYRYLLHKPFSRSRITLAGVSAGANLALALLHRLKKEKIGFPSKALILSPWVDLEEIPKAGEDILTPEYIQRCQVQYVLEENKNNPEISPIFGDLANFPPLFIQTSTCDLLHSQTLRFVEIAKKAGVEVTLDDWEGLIHAFQLLGTHIPEVKEAISRAGLFIQGDDEEASQ